MGMHKCFGDYPEGFVMCLCERGENHYEELFDIPVGEE